MSVVKMILLIATMFAAFGAAAQTWNEVHEANGSSQAWREVKCAEGAGWQECKLDGDMFFYWTYNGTMGVSARILKGTINPQVMGEERVDYLSIFTPDPAGNDMHIPASFGGGSYVYDLLEEYDTDNGLLGPTGQTVAAYQYTQNGGETVPSPGVVCAIASIAIYSPDGQTRKPYLCDDRLRYTHNIPISQQWGPTNGRFFGAPTASVRKQSGRTHVASQTKPGVCYRLGDVAIMSTDFNSDDIIYHNHIMVVPVKEELCP